MKTAIAVLIALVLAGCAHFQGVQKSGAQLIELDGENRLAIAVDGVETRATPVHFVSARAGGPLHRVLQGGDGRILFAYNLDVKKIQTDGSYRLLLRPAGVGSTFAAVREVTLNSKDIVRVQLMEEPGTGRKVEDVFRLMPAEANAADPAAHLQRIHTFFRNLFHGS